MTCNYLGCENTAEHPFLCCNSYHGFGLKNKVALIRSYQQEGKEGFIGLGFKEFLDLTIEELEHYSKFVRA